MRILRSSLYLGEGLESAGSTGFNDELLLETKINLFLAERGIEDSQLLSVRYKLSEVPYDKKRFVENNGCYYVKYLKWYLKVEIMVKEVPPQPQVDTYA